MSDKIGIWLVGARGGVATTAIMGLELLRQGSIPSWGLVSAAPRFASAGLADWGQFVVGGHEIRPGSLLDSARALASDSRAFDVALIDQCRPGFEEIDAAIRPGTIEGCGNAIARLADGAHVIRATSPRSAIASIQRDVEAFATQQRVDRMIVVNVASTEPPADVVALPNQWDAWERELSGSESRIPASSLYAIAALELGCAYINFTPSLGSDCSALRELALSRGACHAGRDGKTGETWLKSVLAPAFAARNFQILSWVGHNIFGNLDGRILDDPQNKASKVTSKDHLLAEILGYAPQTHISIEYIRSLGDWKTAWDHIHFRGFLGTPMILQFTWQGCDSVLAAPLVLDLVRFAELAMRRGEVGELGCLSPFFKSPQGAVAHDFSEQIRLLAAWVDRKE